MFLFFISCFIDFIDNICDMYHIGWIICLMCVIFLFHHIGTILYWIMHSTNVLYYIILCYVILHYIIEYYITLDCGGDANILPPRNMWFHIVTKLANKIPIKKLFISALKWGFFTYLDPCFHYLEDILYYKQC